MRMSQKIPQDSSSQVINIISQGTRIAGDIMAEGDLRIDGFLKGNIRTKGKLVIGSTGAIEGDIDCNFVEISGKVKGKINASDMLSMKSSAMVSGEISTPKLSVEPGSIFSGTCKMGQVADKQAVEPNK